MPVTTGTASIAPEFKTLYHRLMLLTPKPNLVYHLACAREPLPLGYGKTMEFRRYENLPPQTSPLADEINPPAEMTPTISTVTVNINEYGGILKFSRLVQATAYDDFVGTTAQRMGENMGISLDLITRNVLLPPTGVAFTMVTPGGKALGSLTASDVMDYNTLLRAVRILRANNAQPIVGQRPHGRFLGIINEGVWEQMMKDPTIREILQYSLPRSEQHPFFSGEIVHLLGVDFLVTSQAPTVEAGAWGTGVPAVTCNRTLIVGREAAVATELDQISTDIIIRLPQVDSGDPFGRLGWVGWYAAYGTAVLNNQFGVEILTAA